MFKLQILFLFALICALFVQHGQAAKVVGKDPCTWGPGHWCKAVENARKCDVSKNDLLKFRTFLSHFCLLVDNMPTTFCVINY